MEPGTAVTCKSVPDAAPADMCRPTRRLRVRGCVRGCGEGAGSRSVLRRFHLYRVARRTFCATDHLLVACAIHTARRAAICCLLPDPAARPPRKRMAAPVRTEAPHHANLAEGRFSVHWSRWPLLATRSGFRSSRITRHHATADAVTSADRVAEDPQTSLATRGTLPNAGASEVALGSRADIM